MTRIALAAALALAALTGCKTAMMLEASRSSDWWAFTNLDRCMLYQTDLMPERVEIWIVKSVDLNTCTGEMRRLTNTDRPERGGRSAQGRPRSRMWRA